MGLNKTLFTEGSKHSIKALNSPENWDVFVLPNMVKTASVDKADEDLGGFDITAAVDENPEHLFVKIYAIKENEVNDNGDYFCAEELKKSAETFVGVPIFTNHQNDDIEKARGECVHAWYDEDAKGIYIIARVDKIAYPKLARGIEQGYVTGCFPPDAPVLMADGTEKNIADIEDGDYVISGSGNVKKVLGKRMKGYKYPLVSLNIEGIKQPLTCTAYHNIMVYRLPEMCTCGCEEELPERKDKRITQKAFSRKFKQGHNNRDIKFDHQYVQKIKAHEIQEGDFLIEPKIQNIENDQLTEEEAYLIGLFLAEGSFEKRDGVRHSVIFSFAHTELETIADRCASFLEIAFKDHRNKPTVQFYPDASQTRVCMYGKDIAQWFYEKCGEYSDGKRLCSSLLSLSESNTAALIAGYIEGDGYNVNKKYYGLGTVSADLASQLRILFAKIGVRTNYRVCYDDKKRWGYKPVHEITFGLSTADNIREKLLFKQANLSQHPPAKWHSLEDITLRRVKGIEEIDYDGKVYDIEVEDDHTYCVNHIAVSNTSMGTSVEYSVCSICHNKAHTAEDYCSHIKNKKTRNHNGTEKCAYHKSPDSPTDDCPICGCKEGESKDNLHKDAQVFEHNFGLKFIENSFVVNPACHDCGVRCILHVPEITKKVASLKQNVNKLLKAASTKQAKVAGAKELDSLMEALNSMEKVARSMMDQKEHVDMEYVSDLVKTMSDLQTIHDELTDMGYAQLQSPSTFTEAEGAIDKSVEAIAPQQPVAPQPKPQMQQVNSTGYEALPDGMGSITTPNSLSANKKKEFLTKTSKIREALAQIKENVQSLANSSRREVLSNTLINIWEDENNPESRHVIVDINEGLITEAKGDSILKVSNISELTEEMQELASSDPTKLANEILANSVIKESSQKMSTNNEKTAAIGPRDNESDRNVQKEVITEKQLSEKPPVIAPREGDTYEQITESDEQLGRGDDKSNDTTSNSPQKRSGTYETTTEDQLDAVASGHLMRAKDAPEVITEKQWDDMSRLVSGKLSEDYTETITQDQLRDLLSNHATAGTYETITEDQLKGQDWGVKRWANKAYVNSLVKVATEAMSDAIANFQTTPDQIQDIVNQISDDVNFRNKVAYTTVVNSLPFKKEDRVALANHVNYFTKKASKSLEMPGALDALIISVASNVTSPVKVEDVYETISQILSKEKVMAKVDKLVTTKIAKASGVKTTKPVDKVAALNDAFENIDGVQINAVIDEIGASLEDKTAFVAACNKFAQATLEDDSITVLEIKVDPTSGTIAIVTGDEGDPCDDFSMSDNLEEDVADLAEPLAENGLEEDKGMGPLAGAAIGYVANDVVDLATSENKGETKKASREDMVKEAQMMGGEMGGQGGMSQAPGAGATLPGMPGAEAPIESFEDPAMTGELDEGIEEDLQPKPPGSICPVCSSDDVDIVASKGHCNNCGSDMIYKVSVEVPNWAGLTPGKEEDELGEELGDGEGFDLSDEPGLGEGEEFAAAASTSNDKVTKVASFNEITQFPFAIVAQLKPEALEKAAASKVDLGSVSPVTGTTNTIKLENGKYACLDSGTTYKVAFAVPKKGGLAYAQWSWDAAKKNVCESCNRARKVLASSLESIGISSEDFANMSIAEKSSTIIKLKEAKALNVVKLASKTGSIVEEYKKAYSYDEFPLEACHERIARRYGKEAIALSGPCEGKPLYECVCNQLKSAGVYNTSLATKVAESWSDKDGQEECVEDQIRRRNLSIRDAATVCSALKTALAMDEDLFADDLTDSFEAPEDEAPVDMGVEEATDGFEDPFSDDLGGDTVTLELSREVAEELDAKLDVELGSDPTDDLDNGEVVDVADDIDEVVNDEVDEVVEVTDVPEENGLEEAKPMECNQCGQEVAEDPAPCKPCEGGDLEQDVVNKEKGQYIETAPQAVMAETDEEYTLAEAQNMKSSINSTGKVDMDLSTVLAAISKEAGEKQVSVDKAQDSGDIGSYSEGDPLGNSHNSAMGHETDSVPTSEKPSVPRSDARMGHESDSIDKDEPLPNIPSDKGTMGHEDEVGLSGGDNRASGGHDGAGKTETASADDSLQKEAELYAELSRMRGVTGNSSERTNDLYNRLVQAGKLEDSKPVADDSDIAPVSNGKGQGHEPDFTAETPTNTEGSGNESMQGHEAETLGDRPTSPKDHPDFPEDNALMGHEEGDEVGPEKQTKNKGTVIASGDEESGSNSQNEAFRVAGKMLEAGIIASSELQTKVSELSSYKVAQIKDYEKAVFSSVAKAKKGLSAGSEGIEQPLIVSEAQSQKDAIKREKIAQSDQNQELQTKLASLFSLNQQNLIAANETDHDMFKAYRR